jgi:hypothetical protein
VASLDLLTKKTLDALGENFLVWEDALAVCGGMGGVGTRVVRFVISLKKGVLPIFRAQ